MNLTCFYCNSIIDRILPLENYKLTLRTRGTKCSTCNINYWFHYFKTSENIIDNTIYPAGDSNLLYYDIDINQDVFLRVCPNLNNAFAYAKTSFPRKPIENQLFIIKINQIIGLSIPQIKSKIIKLLPFI
jgi:hypothetical protein